MVFHPVRKATASQKEQPGLFMATASGLHSKALIAAGFSYAQGTMPEATMTRMVSESRVRCLVSRRLVATRYRRVRRFRLKNPWGISGGSDGEVHPPNNQSGGYKPPYELGMLIRGKIKSGSLFILPNAKCWAGPATGKKTCAACDEPIIGGVECEVGGPGRIVFVHLICHSLWCKESQGQGWRG